MGLFVNLKGALEVEEVDEDFMGALNALNNAGAQGKGFIVMDRMDGGKMLVNIVNINTVTQEGDG